MPVYEYVCSACGHRADIIHRIDEPGPHFCPECGAEHTMRKAFAPPTIVFKGTGWAKKERRATSGASKPRRDGSADSAEPAKSESGGEAPSRGTSESKTPSGEGSGRESTSSGKASRDASRD